MVSPVFLYFPSPYYVLSPYAFQSPFQVFLYFIQPFNRFIVIDFSGRHNQNGYYKTQGKCKKKY
jgi:hypothetical protein